MSSRKPASVRVFDCLFWLSQAVMLSELLVEFAAPVGKNLASGGAFEMLLLLVSVWVLIACGLWYFASVRKNSFALLVIIGLVLTKAFTYLRIFSTAAWSDPAWILVKIGPLFLLVLATAIMMTSSARVWRAHKDQDLSHVFD